MKTFNVNSKILGFEAMVASTNGCVTVGRAAASDNRDPQFKTSHWQFSFTVYCMGTTDKEKEDGNCPIKKRDSNPIRLNLGWSLPPPARTWMCSWVDGMGCMVRWLSRRGRFRFRLRSPAFEKGFFCQPQNFLNNRIKPVYRLNYSCFFYCTRTMYPNGKQKTVAKPAHYSSQ